MSLDNTSQPSVEYCADKMNEKYIHGRPEPELGPSRYALKVGEIDVMVISDGVLSLPGATLWPNIAPGSDSTPSLTTITSISPTFSA